jgi:hypothetical protein
VGVGDAQPITDGRGREKVFGQSDHVRKFGKDYSQRIERAGLRVDENAFAFGLSDEEVNRYGVIREHIFIGTKPGHG